VTGALDGIRVIDFGQYIAGPLAAVLLADEGSEVIHVDPPGGPRWRNPADAFYNRGKQRITLDLKSANGLTTAQKLVDSADVVIENFRPGVMDRLGLGAAAVTARNPGLVYTSLPGFAPDDPRAGMRAWEGILHAATENCKPRAGEPPADWDWSRPTYTALPLASNFGGFLGATGTVMALIARQRTGKGQLVEVPLFDAVFTLIGHQGAYAKSKGWHPPAGIHGRGAGAFRCGDGRYVQFDTSSARHLTWFARAAGVTTEWEPELLDNARNRDPEINKRLHARLRALFLTKTAAEWEAIGNAAGVAIGFARKTSEWIKTEHAQTTGAVVQVDDPEFGATWTAGLPIRLTESPGAARGPRQLPDGGRAAVLDSLDRSRPAIDAKEPSLSHPLQGMKVIDLCLALAGPTCGRLLGEFGADVVKIDPLRSERGGGHLSRGKRSLLLDIGTIEGQDVFWKLAEQADVVLQNFAPGSTDRLGIGYEEVKARNPDVVYTSISAYGEPGPWKGGRGWERQGQAVAGIMERCATVPAILGPYNIIDIGTGVFGTFATGLAIFHRLRTGKGQEAQASLAQTATYQQGPYVLDYAGYVATEPRGYEALGTGPLNRFYQGSDGWFFLAAPKAEQSDIDAIATVLGIEDHTGIPLAEFEANLEECFRDTPVAQMVARLNEAGISAHAVVPLAEIMEDSYVKARGLSISQTVDGAGEVTMPGLSVHLSATPLRLGHPPGRPGADAPAILAELGMADKLATLEEGLVLRTKNLPPAW
jgi:crotonobetainyl-CoA:carnitine CoA-transferase CaiB-like acyl-CoA transferase